MAGTLAQMTQIEAEVRQLGPVLRELQTVRVRLQATMQQLNVCESKLIFSDWMS